MKKPVGNDFVDLLEGFFRDLEKVAGIGIALHDLSYVTQQRLPSSRYRHNCDYCSYIKSLPDGEQQCRRSDIEEAIAEAGEADEPFLRHCHAGVCEVLVPVRAGGRLLAVAFCGQVFSPGREGRLDVPATTRKKMPTVQEESLLAAARLLDRFFQVNCGIILTMADLERPSQFGHKKLSEAVMLLETEFRGEVNVGEIAKRVGLSVSYFEHLFKRHMTVSFTTWKRRRRVREAMKLLAHTDIKVCEIAHTVGFEDSAYFHRIFKKESGYSPLGYRRMVHRKGSPILLHTDNI